MNQKIKMVMTTLHLKFKKLPVNVQQKQFVITVQKQMDGYTNLSQLGNRIKQTKKDNKGLAKG